MVDYVKPDGQKVMRTIADYRQLNDALFHAGLNSGSLAEWTDVHNRLHFYVIDLEKNEDGILSYELGVRSLDGSGPQKRGVIVTLPRERKIKGGSGYVVFTVRNTGEPAAADTALHHQNTSGWLNSDIFRLTAACNGKECPVTLLNGFISLHPGEKGEVPVYVTFDGLTSRKAKISLTVRSESDPAANIRGTITVKRK
jgi:hypothetical protein